MSETANTSYPNSDAAIQIYYVIWALFAILVVLLPCYIFPRKRALCFKRIRERRWNVSIEDHQIGSVLEGNLRPRYPPGDPRHVVTKEESEKSKRDFIYKRLQNFTKVSTSFLKKMVFEILILDDGHSHFALFCCCCCCCCSFLID
jgi:hypothetical protein